MPGLVPVHIYHPTSKVHAGLGCPLPLRVFQDVVLQEQRADVSLVTARRIHNVIIMCKEIISHYIVIVNRRLKSSQKCDLIKVTLVVVACTILQSVDASRTYHFIRGQNAMKLYAIFNCLEVGFTMWILSIFGVHS